VGRACLGALAYDEAGLGTFTKFDCKYFERKASINQTWGCSDLGPLIDMRSKLAIPKRLGDAPILVVAIAGVLHRILFEKGPPEPGISGN
jgi:hypothetical protein